VEAAPASVSRISSYTMRASSTRSTCANAPERRPAQHLSPRAVPVPYAVPYTVGRAHRCGFARLLGARLRGSSSPRACSAIRPLRARANTHLLRRQRQRRPHRRACAQSACSAARAPRTPRADPAPMR
jgi:hypothetical protein